MWFQQEVVLMLRRPACPPASPTVGSGPDCEFNPLYTQVPLSDQRGNKDAQRLPKKKIDYKDYEPEGQKHGSSSSRLPTAKLRLWSQFPSMWIMEH